MVQEHSRGNRFEEDVLPAVFSSLDRVFPEFGWKRHRRGWVATDDAFTHRHFDARSDRIVCHHERGFYIFGEGSTHWLAYLNSGVFPMGETWFRLASELASRVGLESFAARPLTVAERLWAEARKTLLERSEGEAGRAYLEARRVPWASWPLGYIESRDALLDRAGVARAEAWREKLFTAPPEDQTRWDGRILGLMGVATEPEGFWARSVVDSPTRYLFCGTCAPMVVVPGDRHVSVVVEGPFDAHRVHSVTGLRTVAAMGAEVSFELLERLADSAEVIIALDADVAGETGRKRLVRRLPGAPLASAITFLRPESYGDAKDLDELLRVEGEDGWIQVLEQRTSWLGYAADRELEGRFGADELLALRKIGGLCRAALTAWPAEAAMVVRDLARRCQVDARFVERVLAGPR